MSDLQCAATLLLVAHGETEQARVLGRALRDARLAAIYAGDRPGAVRTAEVVAAETGVPVSVLTGLEDSDGVRATLEGIADLHRGETVLVVSHAGAIRAGVPPMVGLGEEAATALDLTGCAVVEVAVDADGWVLRGRAGGPSPRHWSLHEDRNA
jgi:broad specificity phosphatase PhoE